MAENVVCVGITGSPCCGKTTALDYFRNLAESGAVEYPELDGWQIYVIPEAAERIITYNHANGGGALPEKDWPFFQDVLIKTQKDDIDAIYRKIGTEDGNILIITDRTIADNLGYISHYGDNYPGVVPKLRYECLNALYKTPGYDRILFLDTVPQSVYKKTDYRKEDYDEALALSGEIKAGYDEQRIPYNEIPVFATPEKRAGYMLQEHIIPLIKDRK